MIGIGKRKILNFQPKFMLKLINKIFISVSFREFFRIKTRVILILEQIRIIIVDNDTVRGNEQ